MDTLKQLIIIPTYNEKENIGKMIEAVLSVSSQPDLLIVDDKLCTILSVKVGFNKTL